MKRLPGLRWRERTASEASEAVADPDVGLQSGWTGGPRLVTGAVTVVLWSALLAGPAGLAVAVVGGASAGPVRASAAVVDRVGEQAAVCEFAQRLVLAWLETPRGREQQLAGLVDVTGLVLAVVPWSASDPATAGVVRVGPGVWAVTVGVTVTAPRGSGSAPAPVRRYFQVPVQDDVGGLVAQALPAPVAAPAAGAVSVLGYPDQAGLADPAAVAAAEFLSALLTGVGDVTRLVSPGTVIRPVRPAPYTAVSVTEVWADRDVAAGPPPAGGRLGLLVTAEAAGGPRQQISVQYALTLTARGGRWEVSAVDAAPMLRAGPAPAAPAATPSGTAANPMVTSGPGE